MSKFKSMAEQKMLTNATRGEWYNLVKLDQITGFASWLSDESHEWMLQSPDAGEILRAWKDGRVISVSYDGHRTVCGRYVMALWYTYQCFL